MSVNEFYEEYIALIDKTNAIVTPITINGDASGSLVPYRVELKLTGSGIAKTRNGVLILRSEDSSLFAKTGPILIDEDTKNNYLIEARIDQDHLSATGELFRFEIGKPILDATERGLFITLPLYAIEHRLLESLDSDQLVLMTPKEIVDRRMLNYFDHQGTGAPLVFFSIAGDNALPNDPRLRQNQLPDGPVEVKKLLDEIIDRLANVPAGGGTFTDYYYWFECDPTATKSILMYADVFGAVSSGVIMDVLNNSNVTTEKSQQLTTDNMKWKNVVIVRGPNGSHKYPMDGTIFASDFEHAKVSDNWSVGVDYEVGDYVKFGGNLHKCLVAHNSSLGEEPIPDTFNLWENLSTATRFSPWTNDLDVWYANMFGYSYDATHRQQGVSGGPTGDSYYIGLFADMNLVRPDYDRGDQLNQFENVSFKWVSKINIAQSSAIPSGELFDGQRVLVSSTPTGDFTGHANQIAEYFDNGIDTPQWFFSNNPIFVNNGGEPDDEKDMIWCFQTGKLYKYQGSWVVAWELGLNEDVPSHLHPVKSMANVLGPTGVNSAVEFTFEADFIAKSENKASRWCGWDIVFPFPRNQVHSTKFPVGKLYANPQLDYANLNKDHTGSSVGWNNGTSTEDLGRFRYFFCKLRMGFFDEFNNELDYMYDIPVIFWFMDKFDRVVYTEIKLRRNNVWDTVMFQIGPQANFQLYDNRIDELFRIFGFTFAHDFRLKEREHVGVQFDWRKVKAMGCFWKGAYDENFYYTGAEDSWLNFFSERLKELEKNLFAIPTILFGRSARTVLDYTKCAVDEIYFLKDAYVSSEDSEVADSRQAKEIVSSDPDYHNLKQYAKGFKARRQFFPQFRNFDGYYDARMRLGQTFVAQGSRVPNSPATFVCGEYTITINANGARIEALGVKKFNVV